MTHLHFPSIDSLEKLTRCFLATKLWLLRECLAMPPAYLLEQEFETAIDWLKTLKKSASYEMDKDELYDMSTSTIFALNRYAVHCMSDLHSTSRYSVGGSENEYMDAEQQVLKNKKGIRDLQALYIEEEKALARAYESLLSEVQSDTPITSELIRYVHGVVFGDLYDWAGRWRTVTISKPSVTWPPPDYLDEAMRMFEHEVLSAHPASSLATDENFCKALGYIQGEFLAIHPFREGNARTIKLVTDLLAVQSGRLPLIYDESDDGKTRYIEAAKAAMLKEYDLMSLCIHEALIASKPS